MMRTTRFSHALIAIVSIVAVASIVQMGLWFEADRNLGRSVGSSSGGPIEIQSTTKVDNLDIAGTTHATGLATADTGVNGGTIYATTPDVGEPAFRSVRNATAPGPTTNAQWRFGYSSATTDMIWKYYNGVSTTGPWMQLSIAGDLTVPGVMQSNSQVVSSNSQISGRIILGAANTTTLRTGTGTPEGSVVADVGSLFMRENGAALTTLYVKESGAATNTGWKAMANTDAFTSTSKGLVPPSGGGTANFLRADGTFAVPPGTATGTVTSISQGTGIALTPNPITTTGTIALNITPTTCGGSTAVTAISSAGVGTCSSVGGGTNGSLSGGTNTGYSNGDNLTSIGTVDWALWNQSLPNASIRGAVAMTAQQRKPKNQGAKAGRLWDQLTCACLGSSPCTNAAMCAANTFGGNGLSTTAGANNEARVAVTNNTTAPEILDTGAAQIVTLHLFPSETGTFCVYQGLADVSMSWSFVLYQDGVSQSTQSGNFTTAIPSLTKSEKACVTFTAGTGHEFDLVYTGTLTATGGFNPHGYIMGAEIH